MSSKKVLITGATGYVGGTVLEEALKTFPDLDITALLRRPTEEFTSRYPTVKIVKGTFDDSDIIERAAEAADVIIHAGDHDHAVCAKALLSGAAKRAAAGAETLVLHLTGTGCISDVFSNPWRGERNPRVWDDVADAPALYDLPPTAIHRPVDRLFQDATAETGGLVKTVCVCPPDIFGQGPEVGGARGTFLVPMYVDAAIRHGVAFYLGEGANMRSVTHVRDVAGLFVLLLEKYLLEGGAGLEYGRDGFYFAVTEEVAWKDAAEAICRIGREQGWLPEGTGTESWDEHRVRALVPPHIKDKYPFLTMYLWGSNSRAESTRARRLGWKPRFPFWESLPEDCKVAADASLARAAAKAAQGNKI